MHVQFEYPILDAMTAFNDKLKGLMPACMKDSSTTESMSATAAAELEASTKGKPPPAPAAADVPPDVATEPAA